MIYKSLIRPALFMLNPETVHDLVLKRLSGSPWLLSPIKPAARYASVVLNQSLWGHDFYGPVGLAAGFDKFGRALKAWNSLGFAFAEIGTVTGHAQAGNPRPRLFRLSKDNALINRFGFNNDGAEQTARRLSSQTRGIPIGVNIGKTKTVPLEKAVEDYAFSLDTLWSAGDYFVVNVSSPNTPGLRQLQDKSSLAEIMERLTTINKEKSSDSGLGQKPLLVKIAPDLTWAQVDDVLDVALQAGISGIVATNTTISRDGLKTPASVTGESGGLSGRPVRQRATEVIRYIRQKTGSRLVIIGVGGIFTADDAYEKIRAGASLVQIYTSFVYEGPLICRRLNKGLEHRLKRDGFNTIAEAVGSDVR